MGDKADGAGRSVARMREEQERHAVPSDMAGDADDAVAPRVGGELTPWSPDEEQPAPDRAAADRSAAWDQSPGPPGR